jgi:hypothetical protein
MSQSASSGYGPGWLQHCAVSRRRRKICCKSIAKSLDSDPVLKAAAASREAAQEAKPQARALLLPNVGVNAEQGRTLGISGQTDFNSHNYTLGLEQPLYKSWQFGTAAVGGCDGQPIRCGLAQHPERD